MAESQNEEGWGAPLEILWATLCAGVGWNFLQGEKISFVPQEQNILTLW